MSARSVLLAKLQVLVAVLDESTPDADLPKGRIETARSLALEALKIAGPDHCLCRRPLDTRYGGNAGTCEKCHGEIVMSALT